MEEEKVSETLALLESKIKALDNLWINRVLIMGRGYPGRNIVKDLKDLRHTVEKYLNP